MSTEIKVVAITSEVKDGDISPEELSKYFTEFSGKAAGVCYMKDDYFETGIDDSEKAYNRGISTAGRGHQSPFDHPHFTLKLGVSKAIAMVLNSLGVYTTSEKSARYTLMKPDTVAEANLYSKWIDRIQKYVLCEFPDYDDAMLQKAIDKKLGEGTVKIKNRMIVVPEDEASQIKMAAEYVPVLTELAKDPTLPSYKMAQENARYMISVFTKTVLIYTVSYRQAMLILEYFYKFYEDNKNSNNRFYKKLADEMNDFADTLKTKIGEPVVHDNKNQNIRFLETEPCGKCMSIGDSYTLTYSCSLACLAQLQRHRTIRHSVFMETIDKLKFYTPEIVEKYGDAEEWQRDIKSVSYVFPQGTLVKVTEQGIFEDFALKCKERLCGRAFKETMDIVKDCMVSFALGAKGNKLCKANTELALSMVTYDDTKLSSDSIVVLPRCEFKDFKCTDGCRWGKKNGTKRII